MTDHYQKLTYLDGGRYTPGAKDGDGTCGYPEHRQTDWRLKADTDFCGKKPGPWICGICHPSNHHPDVIETRVLVEAVAKAEA